MNPKSRKEFQSKFDQIATSGDLQGLLRLHSELGSKLTGNIYLAAREGHWDLLRYWHENVQPLNSGNYVEYAALGGHFDIMIWLIDLGCKIKSWVLCKTVEFGNTEGHRKVIKYLFENANLKFDHFSLDRAAENDSFEIFKYLLDSGLTVSRNTLKVASSAGINLDILDHLIDHCRSNSLKWFEKKLITRRKEMELELEQQLKEHEEIPQSPSLQVEQEICSKSDSAKSSDILRSNHASNIPLAARQSLPQIPPATSKLANFQFSDSSDDGHESEDLANPGFDCFYVVSLKRLENLSAVPSKHPREPDVESQEISLPSANTLAQQPTSSRQTSMSLSSNTAKKARVIEESSDEESAGSNLPNSIDIAEPTKSDTKLDILKLEIEKETVGLKSNLAAVQGKKFDLVNKLLERGYMLTEIEKFIKNVN